MIKLNKTSNQITTIKQKPSTNFLSLMTGNLEKIGTYEFKTISETNKLINSQYFQFRSIDKKFTYRAPLKYVNFVDTNFLLYIGDKITTFQIFNVEEKAYYQVDLKELISMFRFNLFNL